MYAVQSSLTTTELSALVDALWKRGDVLALRNLLLELVDEAHVVERQPAKRDSWLRLHVTWTAKVQAFLDAGLLTLGAPVRIA